jgi:hypothetical protein
MFLFYPCHLCHLFSTDPAGSTIYAVSVRGTPLTCCFLCRSLRRPLLRCLLPSFLATWASFTRHKRSYRIKRPMEGDYISNARASLPAPLPPGLTLKFRRSADSSNLLQWPSTSCTALRPLSLFCKSESNVQWKDIESIDS